MTLAFALRATVVARNVNPYFNVYTYTTWTVGPALLHKEVSGKNRPRVKANGGSLPTHGNNTFEL